MCYNVFVLYFLVHLHCVPTHNTKIKIKFISVSGRETKTKKISDNIFRCLSLQEGREQALKVGSVPQKRVCCQNLGRTQDFVCQYMTISVLCIPSGASPYRGRINAIIFLKIVALDAPFFYL